MVQLRRPLTPLDRVTRHVVFVHGLNGSFDKTWMSAGTPPECWPDWLNRSDGTTAIWGVSYGAAALKLQNGASMALPDRAMSLLPLMTSTPELATGDVILVGYSLGGLMIKYILRLANERKGQNPAIGSFLRRVRRVAFIATPHLGSELAPKARVLKAFLREPVFDLPRNDPNLRSLNDWYRVYCDGSPLETLVLWEKENSRYPISLPFHKTITFDVGHIVKPDSANPGVTRLSIYPIDADHFTIVRPADRTSPVFERLKEFIEKPFPPDQVRGPGGSSPSRGPGSIGLDVESPLITAQLLSRIDTLRQSRFTIEFDAISECSAFFESIDEEFSLASPDAKRIAASWCARIVAAKDESLAATMLERAESLGEGIETRIARSYLLFFAEGDRRRALALIADIDTDAGRSSRAILVSHGEPPDVGLQHIDEEGLRFDQLDSDGKFAVLQKTIAAGLWDRGVQHVAALTEEDFAKTPSLLLSAAALLLASTVNDDFRAGIVRYLPTELSTLPMFEDSASIERRRQARALYERAAAAFTSLARAKSAALTADYALWLGLIDPASHPSAIEELRSSMADREIALRRLPFAIEFGLDLDIEMVEAELNQKEMAEDALPQVAAARFAIAKRKGSPAEAVAYIQKYRDQLTKLYQSDWILSVEIELLAKAGKLEEAREKLSNVDPAFPEQTLKSLQRILEEASGSDPIEIREREYAESGSVGDLILLVDVLKAKEAWAKLVDYGKVLFDATRDISSLEAYVQGLFQIGRDVAIIELSQSVPDMFSTHQLVQSLAWSYFRTGDLEASRRSLAQIGISSRDANDRALQVNLSITSGDWLSLGKFVEEEWANRSERTASELLQTGQIAQRVGSHRSQELIRAAAAKADGDAALLAACYTAAANEGWEDSPDVHEWLATAIAASGDDGPIQRIDIGEMISMQPDWAEREKRTWDQLAAGQLPVFGGAQALRRSLLDMSLLPALANLEEPDPRKRGMIFAFSGARPPGHVEARRVAIDASALLSIAFLGLLERVLAHFDEVFISHGLLGWLFEERQRIQFHQPSRVRAALEIKRLIDSGQLSKFEGTVLVDDLLEREVGSELASLIADAAGATAENQHVVIRSYPVPRADTLLEESADLTGYETWIAGCGDLVTALKRQGYLTRAEEEQANSYLSLHEKPWPHTTEIQPNATLYLDSLTVDYLQHLNLLSRLRSAGFSVFIATSETDEGDALIRHQAFSEHAGRLIEEIRAALSTGLDDGKVRLGHMNSKYDSLHRSRTP